MKVELFLSYFKLTRKSALAAALSFLLMFSLLAAAVAKPVQAKTVRVAIVADVSGSVDVQKAGGSKSYKAYKDMSLNQGDHIVTGDGSSVVIRTADHGDEVTIGSNAEFDITDLSNQGDGKSSRFKIWAGSVWAKVKALASADDQFQVETPTAVMGVRGTNFLAAVDAESGQTYLAVASGAVSVGTTTNADSDQNTGDGTQSSTSVTVGPSQQISLNSRSDATNLDASVGVINPKDMVDQAGSPSVITAIIESKSAIDQENQQFILQQQQQLNSPPGQPGQPTQSKGTFINSQADLQKVAGNLDNLLGNVAQTAVQSGSIDAQQMQQIINQVNSQTPNTTNQIDLNNVKPLDTQAGLDPKLDEKRQQVQQEKQEKRQEQQQQQQQIQQQYQQIQQQLAQTSQQLQQQNVTAQQQQQQAAQEQVQQQNQQNQQSQGQSGQGSSTSTPAAGSSSGTPSSGGGAATGSGNDNNSGNTDNTGNSGNDGGTDNSDNSGSSDNSGGTDDSGGSNNSGGGSNGGGSNGGGSTVDTTAPDKPVIVTPVSALITSNPTPSITVRAEKDATIQVLNGSTVVATAVGKGNDAAAVSWNGPLSEGTYHLQVKAKDAAGNVSVAADVPTITVDTTPPTATISYDTPTANGEVKATLIPSEPVTVTNNNGQLTHTFTGNSEFTFEFKDAAGNTGTAKATVDNMNESHVIVNASSETANQINLDIDLSSLTGENAIYGVEAHVIYWTDDAASQWTAGSVRGAIFNETTSADSLRSDAIKPPASMSGVNTLHESTYAVTNFGTGSQNIEVPGRKNLVRLTLTRTDAAMAGTMNLQLIYIKAVNQNGTTVYEFSGGQPMQVRYGGGGAL